MRRTDPDNRFERLLIRHKKSFKIVEYIIKIFGTVTVLLILLESLSFIVVSTYTFTNKGVGDNRLDMDVYENKEWASNYFKEFNDAYSAEYYPYIGYKRKPNYRGNYIQLDNLSVRKTLNPCLNPPKHSIKIFAFGGSTMWGTGARDLGTIPSQLSKYLCDNGYIAEIVNFGESGYTNSQEMIKLQLELRKGNIPDIVIFYDGGNDVYSSYQNGIAGFPQNIQNRKREFNSRDKFNINGLLPNFSKVVGKITKTLKRKNIVIKPSNSDLNIETANIYLNNIRIIKSLEADFGFESFFYWQPLIYTKQKLSSDEKTKIDYEKALSNYYSEVSNLINASDDVTSLISIFDREEGTIFIDWIHISERGNSIIANRIGEDLIKYIKEQELTESVKQ